MARFLACERWYEMEVGEPDGGDGHMVWLRVRPWHPSFWPILWDALPGPWWRKPYGFVYVLWALRPWRKQAA